MAKAEPDSIILVLQVLEVRDNSQQLALDNVISDVEMVVVMPTMAMAIATPHHGGQGGGQGVRDHQREDACEPQCALPLVRSQPGGAIPGSVHRAVYLPFHGQPRLHTLHCIREENRQA